MANASSVDTGKNARRTPVLSAARAQTTAAISIALLEPSARFSLRLRAASATELRGSGPFCFDMPLNTCVVDNSRTIARLGPDEWFLLDAEGETTSLAQALDTRLAGQFFSLVDIGHRNTGLIVAGAHAREVINGGCPLDLSDEAFPAGSATRTILGKAEIILLRPGTQVSYRVECWRSFAPYVHALLQDIAREFASSE